MRKPMINDALRLVRLYAGYSQAELADIIGLSQSMISEVERGVKPVSLDILQRYCDSLNIRMSQLLFFAEELEDEPVKKKGKLIIANKVLKLLEALAPKELADEKS
jgi:transcriptional regulator with XRE-family HTH domain